MNSEYRITFSNEAKKFIKSQSLNTSVRIISAIEALKSNPYELRNVKKMKGFEGNIYRLRVGDYRVIYEIRNEKLWIHIVKIGSRGDVYKDI